MIAPTDFEPPRPGGVNFHRRLSDRSAILPSKGNEDGRVGLSDAMLGLAVLACCFALARTSILGGVVALVIAIPALARTHVMMIRLREEGIAPGVGRWLAAFVEATIRVAFVLGPCALAYSVSFAGGLALVRLAGSALGRHLAFHVEIVGVGVGFVMSALTTFLVLALLVPRLLIVREGT